MTPDEILVALELPLESSYGEVSDHAYSLRRAAEVSGRGRP